MESWRKFLREDDISDCGVKESCNCIDASETDLSIEQVQNMLKEKNFLSSEPSGLCDDETKAAILAFQKENNIECDGCVGDETQRKMEELGYISAPIKNKEKAQADLGELSGLGEDPLRTAGRRSSKFHATANRKHKHNGQDFSAELGTSIYPIAPGVVVAVRTPEDFISRARRALESSGKSIPFIDGDMRLVDYRDDRIQGRNPACGLESYRWVQEAFSQGGFKNWKEGGIWVMIRHDSLKIGADPVTAWYAHLHDLNVSTGDTVDMNTVIGTVGRSGVVCNQPHLHLETFTGQNTVAVSGLASGSTFDPLTIIS